MRSFNEALLSHPTVQFRVPGIPTAKGRSRIGRGPGGRPMAFTPLLTRRYEDTVRVFASQAMGDTEPLDEAVKVHLSFRLPVPGSWSGRKTTRALDGEIWPTGRPDLDNLAKGITDACNGIVWRDDALVVATLASKCYSAQPGVVVEVWPMREVSA